jgi:hypothetical protein
VLPVDPKLYVSPVLLDPVPAVYVAFAFVPVSAKVHPAGITDDVPLFVSESKFCTYGDPGVVRLTHCAAARFPNNVANAKKKAAAPILRLPKKRSRGWRNKTEFERAREFLIMIGTLTGLQDFVILPSIRRSVAETLNALFEAL